MTTTAVTTAAGPILAIDLGKYKCVACVYSATSEPTFQTMDTSRTEVARLIGRTCPAVVVIEACSLAGWVHDLCGELGVSCRVANTAAEAWKYKHTKRKTDRHDAVRLAQLLALAQPPEVVVPAKGDAAMAGADCPPAGAGDATRRGPEPHPLDPGRPGPAGPARRSCVDRRWAGRDRSVRAAPGRVRTRRAKARHTRAGPNRLPPGGGVGRRRRGQARCHRQGQRAGAALGQHAGIGPADRRGDRRPPG